MDLNELRDKLNDLFSGNEGSDISIASFEYASLPFLIGVKNNSSIFEHHTVFYAVEARNGLKIFPVNKKYDEQIRNFAEEHDVILGELKSSKLLLPSPYIKGDKAETFIGLRVPHIYFAEMASYRKKA
jgi:hypothetical protein